MDLYFDCFSGLSGDMTLGAFVHLGLPENYLKEKLGFLGIDFDLTVSNVVKSGISGKSVNIIFDEKNQPHRHYKDIKSLIQSSRLSDTIKQKSVTVFDLVAQAESEVHDCDVDHVHFHEVGAVDSIMDIVGFALALDFFNIETVYASPVPLGGGTVKCAHGFLPVPAPAVTAILKNRGDIPVYSGGIKKELLTPTGAAILAATVTDFGDMPPMRIKNIGYGAGKHDFSDRPNMVRLIMGEPATPPMSLTGKSSEKDCVTVIECNVDDMNGEWTGFLMERLLDRGALDVMIIPAQMKKNRPGVLLKVICDRTRFPDILETLFAESTTIGIRYYDTQRVKLKRRSVTIKTPLGEIAAKEITGFSGDLRIVPEFEAAKRAAKEKGLPVREVYEMIICCKTSS